VSKQLDLEVECLAERLYAEHCVGRYPQIAWALRCQTVKDGYRAIARRAPLAQKLEGS
jgi:hypothetical protein